MTPPELKGIWKQQAYESFGTPENIIFHVSWEFLDGGRVLIETPKYRAMPQQTIDRRIDYLPARRFQVYNTVGTNRVNVFSGIWSVTNNKLTLAFNTGDEFPTETTEPALIEVKLVMARY